MLRSSIHTIVLAVLAAAVFAVQAPSATAQNSYSYQNHHSSVSNGYKQYWYNGQHWEMNLRTGHRRQVSGNGGYSGSMGYSSQITITHQHIGYGGHNPQSYVSGGYKHYWYNGEHWEMNLHTGHRRRVYDNGRGGAMMGH